VTHLGIVVEDVVASAFRKEASTRGRLYVTDALRDAIYQYLRDGGVDVDALQEAAQQERLKRRRKAGRRRL
jgi:hypothetical protein